MMHEEHNASQMYDLLEYLLSRSIRRHQFDQKIAAYFLLQDAKEASESTGSPIQISRSTDACCGSPAVLSDGLRFVTLCF